MNFNGLSVATSAAQAETALWGAASWSVVVSHQGRQKRYSPPLPYARIGSHPGCEIVLDNPRLPAVAYLLVAFNGHVEAWPVAPIAMPRWGALAEGEEFPIGTFRISVDLDEPATRDDVLGERYPELGVVVGDRRWSAKLQRRVTIVGDDHPSVKRLRDVGLQACHGAFIAVEQQLWYLPLSPQEAPCLTNHCLAVEMSQGEPVQTGRVRFLRLPANGSLPAERQAVERQADGMRIAAVELNDSAGHGQPVKPVRSVPSQIVSVKEVDSLMMDISNVQPTPSPNSGSKRRDQGLDGVASQSTDRLRHLGRRRAKRSQRKFTIAVVLSVLVAAVVLPLIWYAISAR